MSVRWRMPPTAKTAKQMDCKGCAFAERSRRAELSWRVSGRSPDLARFTRLPWVAPGFGDASVSVGYWGCCGVAGYGWNGATALASPFAGVTGGASWPESARARFCPRERRAAGAWHESGWRGRRGAVPLLSLRRRAGSARDRSVGAGAGGVAPMARRARSYQEAAERCAAGMEQPAAAVEEVIGI